MTLPPLRRAAAVALWALAVGLAIRDGGSTTPWFPAIMHTWSFPWLEVAINIALITIESWALYRLLIWVRLKFVVRLFLSLGLCLTLLVVDQRWAWTDQAGPAYTNGTLLLCLVGMLVFAIAVATVLAGLDALRRQRASWSRNRLPGGQPGVETGR